MNMAPKRRDFTDAGMPRQELPSNIEAEQQILGTLLMNSDALAALPSKFDPDHFYEPLHHHIFEAIRASVKAGKLVNPVTLRSFLSPEVSNAAVGEISVSSYLARLMSDAVTVDRIEGFASAVTFEAQRRDGIGTAGQIETICRHTQDELGFADAITESRDRLNKILATIEGRDVEDDDSVVDDYLRMITGENEADGSDGIPLPFPDFEYLINDNMLRPGRTYGILAASAEGKTSLTLQVVFAALMAGHPVCILSYDQDQMEILAQMTAQQEGIPFSAQLQNSRNHQRLSQQQIDKGYAFVRKLKHMPFEVIQCRTSDTVSRLEAKMDGFLRRRANGRMPLFVVDHIRAIRSSIQGDEGSKAMQIGQDLHDAMKARRSAGWILQQRSTSGLKRDNPRPASADLYGGDAAKQPFDVIFYAFRATEHRDEQVKTARDEADAEKIRNRFAKIYGKDRDDEYIPIEGMVEIGMIKNRFGNKNRRAILKFDPEYTRFSSRRRQEQEALL